MNSHKILAEIQKLFDRGIELGDLNKAAEAIDNEDTEKARKQFDDDVEKAFQELLTTKSVSYTHLDVYKRQQPPHLHATRLATDNTKIYRHPLASTPTHRRQRSRGRQSLLAHPEMMNSRKRHEEVAVRCLT